MLQNKTMTVEIQGHTDDQGGSTHNQQLSENRARAVFNYLTQQGVKEQRMKIKGYGLSKPVDSNVTEIGRKRNRRVEFVTNTQEKVGEGFIPSDIAYLFSKNVKENPYRLSTIGKDERYWDCNVTNSLDFSESMRKEGQSFSKYTAKNAHDFILEKTKNQKAVFLQALPEYSNQLTFAYVLLEEMYQQGYRQIGFRNMENFASFSNASYPTLNLGQPFQHPIYGSILRKAKDLGFKVFTFNPSNDQINKAKKILKKDNFRLDEVEEYQPSRTKES